MTGIHWNYFKPRYIRCIVKLWEMNVIGLLSLSNGLKSEKCIYFAISALIRSLLTLLDFPDRVYTVNWDLGFCIQVLALHMFFLSYYMGQEL